MYSQSLQPSPTISVALLEDDAACATRFIKAIAQSPNMRLLQHFDKVAPAMAWLSHNTPDVLLCDLGLPDASGLEIIRFCKVHNPDVKVLVITLYEDEPHVVKSIEAGARGYLLKDCLGQEITEHIEQLQAGGSPLTPLVARYLLKKFQPKAAPALPDKNDGSDLSEREMQVLVRISQGFSYAEIAALLDLSKNTVHTYIKRIYEKLSVHSRTEAVFEARQMGLIG